MRKGRSRAQESLNQAIDDLLSGDDGDMIAPKGKLRGNAASALGKKHNPSTSPKKALSSGASSKDFYSSLSAIAGHDISEANDEEEVDVDSEDAANIAKGLADMDDLESDLFGSFTNKKSGQKPKVGTGSFLESKQRRKKYESTDFDEDDPLAGLGLSDDEDIPSNKSKSRKPELSRRLSQTSSKVKVDPNITASDAQNQSTSPPVRSPSFDKDDPFLATDPRPRSGSINERKIKRMNSWDEPSLGTQSESELTPRSRSGSGGQQMKNGRRGSNKKKVNPSPPKLENSNQDRSDPVDLPDSGGMDSNQSVTNSPMKSMEKSKTANKIDDMFADEEDLPGLSDEESFSPAKKVVKKAVDDEEPTRKAAAALDDLLGGKSKVKDSKSRRPTFLEQMMSKNTVKRTSVDTESPVTSPKNEDVTFGGYSPSVGEAKERPLTAPNKRSVRFADELGLDGLDLSLNDSRPSTAPGSGRSRNANRLKDATIGSSFEDDNTDVSLELSTNEFKRPLQPTLNKKDKKENQRILKEARDGAEKTPGFTKTSSPQRKLQNSRRTGQYIGDVKESSQDDWLGLDDDTFATFADKSNNKPSEATTAIVRNEDEKAVEFQAGPVSQDDWLGLSDEKVKKDHRSESQEPNEGQSNQQIDHKKKSESSITLPNDELFPWETPRARERQKRRSKRFEDAKVDSELQRTGISVDNKGGPVDHSSPKDSKNENGDPPAHKKQSWQQQKTISSQSTSIVPSAVNPDSSNKIIESAPQTAQPGMDLQHHHLSEYQKGLNQQPFLFPGNNVNATSSSNQMVYNQDALLAQIFAAQRAMAMGQIGFNDQSTRFGANSKSLESSPLSAPMEKLNADTVLQQHKIKEYEIAQKQSENDLKSLEAELRTLYSKVSELEQGKTKVELESSKKIEDLEEKVRKLEMENDHLNNSQDMLKKRHADEMKALESSHKMRFQILEDTYKRRETQLKEENDFVVKQLNERIRASETEKNEIAAANKERLVIIEKSRDLDMERLKSLHKKAIDDLRKDYDDQLERLRLLKEQEVAAATSMFSQTRSLQTLIQQVHNSTTEVEQMQKRIDTSHKNNLNDREQTLRVRDEYLKSMQEKLQRQEVESMEERSRLQTLVAKLELQLREQGRQLEQERWKISQDENRIKSMQDALEEERKYTLQQLNNERQMVDKSRDELMNEQRRILANCHEEQRRVTAEKANLEEIQRKYNRENLDKEFAALNDRESKISKEEERLKREMQVLEDSFRNITEDKQKLQEFAKLISTKSKEVEDLSKEAMKMQQEGIESLEHAQALKMEVASTSELLENRAMLLDQQERELSEKLASHELARTQFEPSKDNIRCSQCQRPMGETPLKPTSQVMMENKHQITIQNEAYPLEQQPNVGSLSSPAASVISSSVMSSSSLAERQADKESLSRLQPPDVILGSLNFNRTVRKWSADKEQDEEFFEEEGRFLNEILRKRGTKLADAK